MWHPSRSQPGIKGSSQPSTARGRPSSEFPWYCTSSAGLVRTCVGCELSRIRNYDPIRGPADTNAVDQSAVRLLCQYYAGAGSPNDHGGRRASQKGRFVLRSRESPSDHFKHFSLSATEGGQAQTCWRSSPRGTRPRSLLASRRPHVPPRN